MCSSSTEFELLSLVPGTASWRAAAQSLLGRGRLRALVVKAGPMGAALVTASGTLERPAAPVDVVMDPTGAGDAVAGGFLGRCAVAQRDDEGFFPEALEEGLQAAAAAISSFGTAAVQSRSRASLPSQERQPGRGRVGS